ncbi:MAG: sodium:solute symporter [Armatimonadota bacterium]
MNLSWIDWAIMGVSVVALRLVSLGTRQYMQGVADFLSANRSAGRYLLTIASQMGGIGVVTFVGGFELMAAAGLSPSWWGMMMIPASVVILLMGWVFYRFRETRALTMAQFFEIRYSRNFRVFAGLLCWFSGILNFGIFPAVAARFFVYFCGLPEHFHCPGIPWELSTYITVMATDMILALSFVMMGGQISVMITECVQGMFCTLAMFVVSAAVLLQVKWPQMVAALKMAPADKSMLNPFHTSGVTDFNLTYGLIGLFSAFYTYMSWQGSSGFYSSARTPHEQKMGGIIGVWRAVPQNLMIIVLPLAALAILRLPEYSHQAAAINDAVSKISGDSIQGQMRVPIALAHILPTGIKGLLATVMLFVSFTCHDTYMHSWGTIFIQDVYMPWRNKQFSPAEHIRLLRLSILGVAVFAFLFSIFYRPTQYIFMYFAATGMIWTGGSGAVIIGGLYWKKGTTAGAYCALTIGAVLGIFAVFADMIWMKLFGHKFPINAAVLSFFAMGGALILYVLVSLVLHSKNRFEFNLQKMLYRGQYAKSVLPLHLDEPRSIWLKITGITSEFTLADRVLAIILVPWNGLNFIFFVVFSVINKIMPVADSAWANWWHFNILWSLVLSVPIIVWFTIGGVIDIKALFKTLAAAERDASDNGTVRDESIRHSEPLLVQAVDGIKVDM